LVINCFARKNSKLDAFEDTPTASDIVGIILWLNVNSQDRNLSHRLKESKHERLCADPLKQPYAADLRIFLYIQ
jgi:hypothetical protein